LPVTLYTKSDGGLRAMKDRHAVDITRVQRSALILFDGQRSVRAVLEATAAMGVTAGDVDRLLALGLLQPVAEAGAAPAPSPMAAAAQPALPAAQPSAQERAQRYRAAYPLASELTAQLGLRGFTLNLAVEAAQGFEGLLELLPRLRAAVGDERIRPLEDALLGP